MVRSATREPTRPSDRAGPAREGRAAVYSFAGRDLEAYDGGMPRQLPPDFAWYTPTWNLNARSLRIGHEWGMEVAFVSPRADGITWLSIVNRHRGPGMRRSAVSSSQAIAMKWAGLWAAAHAERLRAMAVEWEKPKGKWVAFRSHAS